MKKKILISTIFTTIVAGSITYAMTVGIEPPQSYINNLKTCTKSSVKSEGGMISEYIIKGKLPNGRCEVVISHYANYADPKVYEQYKSFTKSFIGSVKDLARANGEQKEITVADIPTQAQMIEQSQKDKEVMTCKFSNDERKALYEAYQKHDSKNPPAKVGKDGSYSFSFDTNKMSSYEKLMMNLSMGPCSNSKDKQGSFKKYACEYADTTCYVTMYNNGVSSMKCTNEYNNSLKIINKVVQHAKSGMCQQI